MGNNHFTNTNCGTFFGANCGCGESSMADIWNFINSISCNWYLASNCTKKGRNNRKHGKRDC